MDAAVSLRDHVARRIDPHLVPSGPLCAQNPARERAALRRHGALHGMGVGGLAPHFAVESDELRLKTNVRGGPLSARYCRYQRANSGFALARTEGQRITRPRVTN